jgi:hypothetical protein
MLAALPCGWGFGAVSAADYGLGQAWLVTVPLPRLAAAGWAFFRFRALRPDS